MIEISVENLEKIQRELKDMPGKQRTVLSRAINRAVTNVKKNISVKVRKNYILKAETIKDAIGASRTIEATPEKLAASIELKGHKLDMFKAGTTGTGVKLNPLVPSPKEPPKRGYRMQIKKGGGLKVVPGGFLANTKHGIGMFMREGASRYPIKRIMFPAIPELVGNPDVLARIEKEGTRVLNQRAIHELERVLGRKLE